MYEYTIVRYEDGPRRRDKGIDLINEYGKGGWKVCSVLTATNIGLSRDLRFEVLMERKLK